jgi:hypothetical protein
VNAPDFLSATEGDMCSLLAAYDLGAPPKLLQAMYDNDAKPLRPIGLDEVDHPTVTTQNWREYLGVEK